jgi:aminoglycoside/choline kinase family phosphotransferase
MDLQHSTGTPSLMPHREQALRHWLQQDLQLPLQDLQPASSDASFRRYFRVFLPDGLTRIAMDAPPPQEDTGPFVRIAAQLRGLGLNAPVVHAAEPEQGFLLLDDLGQQAYLGCLDSGSVNHLYSDAMRALLQLQRCQDDGTLPRYDAALLRSEIQLFVDWFLHRHLGLDLDAEIALGSVFGHLIDSALAQPQVCVHRDYHSRNLMKLQQDNPGVIDFQDAVWGPVTYDLVSLLRDCYIDWPRAQVEDWARDYHQQAMDAGLLQGHALASDFSQFLRWFDWMGVQRHLKAIGIFARLHHRDGKSGYLGDIPRTLGYVREVSHRYPELAPLYTLLTQVVDPAWQVLQDSQ